MVRLPNGETPIYYLLKEFADLVINDFFGIIIIFLYRSHDRLDHDFDLCKRWNRGRDYCDNLPAEAVVSMSILLSFLRTRQAYPEI